ncbi:MAG: hypothetical protein ABI637_08760 [Gemmatimonadota bacterium]
MRARLLLVASAAVGALGCGNPTDISTASSNAASLAGAASPNVHRVTGGGRLDLTAFGPHLSPETYGINASIDAEGTMRGQVEIQFSDPAVTLHVEVTCLSVSGNDAWIGGAVTHTSDPTGHPEGVELIFRVQDNGEGRGAPADRMSGVFIGAPAALCARQPRFARADYEFAGGGITVR